MKIVLRSRFFIKKHISKEESIYILGNGPSFKKQFKLYSTQLAQANLMCVNGFSLSENYEILKPSNYLVASPGFYNYDAIDYNVEVRKNIIKAIIENTSWDLNFYLPVQSKKNKSFTANLRSNKYIKLIYFNTTPADGFDFIRNYFYRSGLGSPRLHNVMIASILQSINSGIKNIFLLGADHSWLPELSVNNKNEVLLHQKHFYDEGKSKPIQMHKNEGQDNRKLHEVLEKFYFSFRSYHQLNQFASLKKAIVVNLTEGSFIDAFKKESIEDHFNRS